MSLVYLDELCDSISETYDKNTKDIVLINTSDVFNGKVLNHEFVPNKDIKGQFKKLFQKGDILYSEIRPANKHYAFVDFESKDYVASTKLMVLRPKKEKIRSKYLYYILKNKDVVNFLQGLAESRSGTFPQITFSELSTIDIDLPSLENQDIIVEIIDNIESKIENLEKINKNLSLELTNSQYKLEDICLQITDGKHGDCENEENSGYYFVSVKDIDDGAINYSNARQITKFDFEETDKRTKLENEDILITNSGTIGKFVFVNSPLSRKTTFQKSVAIIKPDKKKIIPKFLYYYLISEKRRLVEYAGGTTQKNLLLRDIRNFEVEIPDEIHQTKIIEILNNIDQLILVNKKLNKNLEQLMKCIFDDWFVNFNYSDNISFKSSELGEIPEFWNVKTLGDILDTLESGKRPKGGISEIDDGIPSIGAENILGLGKFDYSKNKLISHEFFNKLKKGIIKDQDVLLYKDGAQLGRKSLFMNGFPFDICCINEHVFRLQSNDEVSQFYLYLWLDQEIMTNEIINLNSNSAQPGINQNDVKSLPILVPEVKVMDKFTNIISPMMNKIFDNALEIKKLSNLRDTLLPKLMSGEIDVSQINCDLE